MKSNLGATILSGLNINVLTNTEILQLGFNETYELDVPSDGKPATLTANNVYGAIRGLETFAQLINPDWDGNFMIPLTPIHISDYPRFPHRSLLIDTSRHYLSVSTIIEVLDLMAYSKFNILHWVSK